jgi:hypothetical protein
MVIQLYDAIELCPAEIDLGYFPKMLFDWKARLRKPINSRNRML